MRPSRVRVRSSGGTNRTNRDDSIGSSVNATSSDIATANAIVRANDLKNWPTMPVMKPTGRNTARMVKVVAITARPISDVPFAGRGHRILALLHVAVDVLAHHHRIVDEDADDERQRHQRHHVDGEARHIHEEEGGDRPTSAARAPRSASSASRA